MLTGCSGANLKQRSLGHLSAACDFHHEPRIAQVEALPNEILTLILEFGAIGYKGDSLDQFISSTSRVNRRWRECVFQTPALWSILQISMALPVQQTLHSLSLCLERSKENLLDITFDLSAVHSSYVQQRVMSRIGSHSSRWKRANILLSGNGASGLAAFSAFAAPNLVDLSISTTGWISDSASFFERVRMPNVSSFTIKSANLSNSRLHFHRLTVMRVYGGIVGPGFFKGFSTSQTLVHLELHFFFPSLYSVFGVDVVTHINSVQSLPTLRSFRILARGFAPQIDLQHWVDEHTQATEDDESPSAQSLIVTFELYEISPQSYVDDIPFEAALSHLTHLSLHQVTTDGLLRRLVAPFGGPPPCPLLRSLLISCDSHGNHTLLREVITWRKAAGCPIVQLRLDKHFSNDHQFLNWVEENVELVIDTGECSKHKRRFG